MRRLIINADDFGLTRGVNRAILEAHSRGVVTSATLMAAGGAFEDATAVARSAPRLSVGCHVVLVDGRPLLPETQIPTLLAGGQFPPRLLQFARLASVGKLNPAEIEAEATAQFGRLRAAGISPSHFDTHKHTHLFAAVARPLLRAARACGIRAVRNPFAPWRGLPLAAVARAPQLWSRWLQMRTLGIFSHRFRRLVKEAGMVTTDGCLGIEVTGRLDERWFAAIAAAVPEGVWEFICHPGYDDADLAQVRTRLRASRARELEILTSPAARDALAERAIELISFRDLARGD
jgi:hopanoid biosynthesis associated protein HpnK